MSECSTHFRPGRPSTASMTLADAMTEADWGIQNKVTSRCISVAADTTTWAESYSNCLSVNHY